MAEKGKALPKFGEWDLKDPATADGFTLIFNRARNEKKTRATAPPPPSIVPQKVDTINKPPPSPPKVSIYLSLLDFLTILTTTNSYSEH
ncbi:hypothetical protein V6Z11_A12G219900 [Gossypium hirsutum]